MYRGALVAPSLSTLPETRRVLAGGEQGALAIGRRRRRCNPLPLQPPAQHIHPFKVSVTQRRFLGGYGSCCVPKRRGGVHSISNLGQLIVIGRLQKHVKCRDVTLKGLKVALHHPSSESCQCAQG